jgi:LPXTG-motif cell wall-anchored protein
MFSAIEYPHWLMIAGAFLVLSGLIGLAFRKNRQTSEDKGVESAAPSPIQAAVEPEMK